MKIPIYIVIIVVVIYFLFGAFVGGRLYERERVKGYPTLLEDRPK